MYYNFGPREFPSEEAPGISVFYRDERGEIFHTYSALPFTMAWVRHHDRYGDSAGKE